MTAVTVDLEKAVKCNGGMIYKSAIPHSRRKEFFNELGNVPLNELAEKYFPEQPQKNVGILNKVKELVKMIPGVYERYYFDAKKKEFENRCKKSDSTGSIYQENYIRKKEMDNSRTKNQ